MTECPHGIQYSNMEYNNSINSKQVKEWYGKSKGVVHVNSASCRACKYFVRQDMEKNIVECSKKSEMIKLLYIDLFCGAGGTTTGVEAARIGGKKCAKVIACVNHDANAIRSHAANHPEALHFTEDIRTLDIAPLAAHLAKCRKLYPGAKVVLWASLECTNFSKAKGGLPRDADSRTLAEHLFRYIEALDPDYIQIDYPSKIVHIGSTGGRNDVERIHPTQKPVKLYLWLMQKFCKPGDSILDTHLGSGSSRIAAYELGFDFVGTEIDKEYYESQEKRFQAFKTDFDFDQKLFVAQELQCNQLNLNEQWEKQQECRS